eukprot:TRINITY_DN1836_c0_g1_i6.p1 TRINITY_DN1836_c0_g1~~TRINITY_DN1836_c0_g1_i6.p1  ORF type:complete len:361 (-),score=66.23 TRINITY_DN1836_c0_g1_i6:113-1195(-)
MSAFTRSIRSICQLSSQPPYWLTSFLGTVKPVAFLAMFGGPRLFNLENMSNEEVEDLVEKATYNKKQIVLTCFAASFSVAAVVTDLGRFVAVLHAAEGFFDLILKGSFVMSISTFASSVMALNGLAVMYYRYLDTDLNPLVDIDRRLVPHVRFVRKIVRKKWQTGKHLVALGQPGSQWLAAVDSSKGRLWRMYWQASVLVSVPYRIVMTFLGVMAMMVFLPFVFATFVLLDAMGCFLGAFAMRTVKKRHDALLDETTDISLNQWIDYFETPLMFGVVWPFFVPCLVRFLAGDGYMASVYNTFEDRHFHDYAQAMLAEATNMTEVANHTVVGLSNGTDVGNEAQLFLAAVQSWIWSLSLVV